VFLALVVGKPLGILAMSWAAVRAGWCTLPDGTTWRAVLLVGLLGGIGFTMAIFIGTLAFPGDELLGAAKFGVMTGSAVAAILGLTLGYLTVRRRVAGSATARVPAIEEH
jgi:NhaA family Na+:H+ antiporter